MVMRALGGALLSLGVAGQAAAAGADWSQAGGSLLVPLDAGPMAPAMAGASPAASPLGMAAEVRAAARRQGLDPRLLQALVLVESGGRRRAVSTAGAAGLTQLMPATAAELGVTDRFDVGQNLDGGARYLARQLARFGDLRLALAAYNAGPGAVARLGRTPRIPETQNYVRRVVNCYLGLTIGLELRSVRDCPGDGRAP